MKQVWIGRAEVVAQREQDILERTEGAFVNVLALASSAIEFQERAGARLDEYGLVIVDMEDIESFDDRVAHHTVDPEMISLAREARRTGEVELHTFHIFPLD